MGDVEFAAYAVFGHRRPLNAVVVVGLLLVANMSLTVNDQLLYLVLFSIGRAVPARSAPTCSTSSPSGCAGGSAIRPAISSVYLRGGTVFIVAAVRLAAS